MTHTIKAVFFVLILAGVSFTSCKKPRGCTDPTAENYDPEAKKDDGSCTFGYDVPQTYNFENVSYSGQTARLLLLDSLESLVRAAKTRHVTEAELLAVYENTANLFTDISTDKRLSDKAEANADLQVRTWFSMLDTMSLNRNTYVTADSVDLSQMIGKTVMGAVFYYRAITDYLNGLIDDDNTTVTPGKGTEMEHHWDEAFGYFGAARDYNSYTDAEIKSPGYKDSDMNGQIDPQSERNFYYAMTAAKRDLGTANLSASSQTDYTKTLFDAWLKGRAAISNNEYTDRDAARAVILQNWEEIIAATAVHYINDTKDDMASGSADLFKHWAEMKAYFGMLQYNPERIISDADFNTIDALLGNKPSETDAAKLDQAAAKLQNIYGFTTEQVNNWKF